MVVRCWRVQVQVQVQVQGEKQQRESVPIALVRRWRR
jgi:hypothetical protein